MDRAITAPESVATGFKRYMGTKSPVRFGNAEWTPVECSTEIIKTLVNQAKTESGCQPIEGSVITIPAAFNQMQSEDTMTAAKSAGLERVSLLQEPVAAALAAITTSKLKDGVFLIYDLGGGTFDLALVMSSAGSVNVVAHEGINMLGGRDFDRIIFDSIVRQWLHDNFSLPRDFQRHGKYKKLPRLCHYAIETAKIQLTTEETASIFASEDDVRIRDEDGAEMFLHIDLRREEFNELISTKVDESMSLCRKIISTSGYDHGDIAMVVPIGGPSKMGIIREMLESELAIEVESSLDPMTAVAEGAAIFAESRNWEADGGESTQKPTQSREKSTGKVSFDLKYKTRITRDSSRVQITPEAATPLGFEVEIIDEEGTTTGRMPFKGRLDIDLKVRKDGLNRFRLAVYDSRGRCVEESSKIIEIMRVSASASSIPMTYNLAIKIQEGVVGYEQNKLETLVAKGAPLPAQGTKTIRAAKAIVGGRENDVWSDNCMMVEFYDKKAELDDPEHALFIGHFEISGADLSRGERINRGEEIIIDWKLDDNSTLKCALEVPKLGRVFDENFYFPSAGNVNYEGEKGAEVADLALKNAESDLKKLEELSDGQMEVDVRFKQRIEEQHQLLSSSVDADTHRAVSEESRKIRQDIAILMKSDALEASVLEADIEHLESSFDYARGNASSVDVERFEKLLVSARLAIRDQNYDLARRQIDEMKSIFSKVLHETPDFVAFMFRRYSEEKNLAIDDRLHQELVKEGRGALEKKDLRALQIVLSKMAQNRVILGEPADVTALADIFK